jgi:hypothetical protein
MTSKKIQANKWNKEINSRPGPDSQQHGWEIQQGN